MNKRVAMKWVRALRSGEYKQAKGTLQGLSGGYCCLGVLCKIAPKYAELRLDNFGLLFGVDLHHQHKVKEWAELRTDDGRFPGDSFAESLAGMNDNGTTFEELANIIEKEWEKL